ncbi:hypothetical protein AK812_SmicGene13963 [Symbiodinium microadriaticum]|uniref:Uncharacterized protein n=1 Tax=Symbiodinium microadriaticum TaxID=2951 RepID=A0A1Q9E6S8_SYMMI|nr:hypothetical protein AK812_SmicGene13963 [Symbiodinium microadriaticum]
MPGAVATAVGCGGADAVVHATPPSTPMGEDEDSGSGLSASSIGQGGLVLAGCGAAVWACRRYSGGISSTLPQLASGVYYSAVPTDGGFLDVEETASARRAPLRADEEDEEMVPQWRSLLRDFWHRAWARLSALRGERQRRRPAPDSDDKEDACSPEEKQGLLGGPLDDDDDEVRTDLPGYASPLADGDEESVSALIKLRPSATDSVGTFHTGY